MIRYISAATLLILSITLFGCASTDEEWEPFPVACMNEPEDSCSEGHLVVDGVQRTFILTQTLSKSDTPGPIVLVWHGSGTNAEYIRRRFSLPSINGAGTIVVYPNGLPRPELNYRTGWNRDPEGNDIRFFEELVSYLAERFGADQNKVFSVGHSRGGRFVDVLSCYRGSEHLALASISAGTRNVSECPGRAPIWITHGRNDSYVSFRHGKDWIRRWSRTNECGRANPGSYPNDLCTELPGCAVPVVWCPHTSEFEGGHGPPPFAEREIEEFFARFI